MNEFSANPKMRRDVIKQNEPLKKKLADLLIWCGFKDRYEL